MLDYYKDRKGNSRFYEATIRKVSIKLRLHLNYCKDCIYRDRIPNFKFRVEFSSSIQETGPHGTH